MIQFLILFFFFFFFFISSAALQQESRRAAFSKLPSIDINHALLGKAPKKD
jgi:chorismate synthase